MKRIVSVLLAAALLSPAGIAQANPDEIRGWTLLSSNDTGNERTIAARINHLQLSHDVIHHLRQLEESESRRQRAVRLTDQAHAAGIKEVAVWDHALYSLTQLPRRVPHRSERHPSTWTTSGQVLSPHVQPPVSVGGDR